MVWGLNPWLLKSVKGKPHHNHTTKPQTIRGKLDPGPGSASLLQRVIWSGTLGTRQPGCIRPRVAGTLETAKLMVWADRVCGIRDGVLGARVLPWKRDPRPSAMEEFHGSYMFATYGTKHATSSSKLARLGKLSWRHPPPDLSGQVMIGEETKFFCIESQAPVVLAV